LLKNKDSTVVEHGFLVAVEVEQGLPTSFATPEAISNHIKDSVRMIEGVGIVDTHYLGPIEIIEEEDKNAEQ
jgi:dUTPase